VVCRPEDDRHLKLREYDELHDNYVHDCNVDHTRAFANYAHVKFLSHPMDAVVTEAAVATDESGELQDVDAVRAIDQIPAHEMIEVRARTQEEACGRGKRARTSSVVQRAAQSSQIDPASIQGWLDDAIDQIPASEWASIRQAGSDVLAELDESADDESSPGVLDRTQEEPGKTRKRARTLSVGWPGPRVMEDGTIDSDADATEDEDEDEEEDEDEDDDEDEDVTDGDGECACDGDGDGDGDGDHASEMEVDPAGGGVPAAGDDEELDSDDDVSPSDEEFALRSIWALGPRRRVH
jgi:NADH:ubiquinone oxidoreductase subunit